MRKVCWHLPGLYMNIGLYQRLIPFIHSNPQVLRDGHEIYSVYGSFPNTIWNGGRSFVGGGFCTKHDIENVIDLYKSNDIRISLTWTNNLLRKEHLYDTYCNMITEMCHYDGNYVITLGNPMYDYIKQRYPIYSTIASVTRQFPCNGTYGLDRYYDYDLIVLQHEFNQDITKSGYLDLIKSKLEVMVNQVCVSYCDFSWKHYTQISDSQLQFEQCGYRCPHKKVDNIETGLRCNKETFISDKKVDELSDYGIRHFKIVGRTEDNLTVLRWILYYCIKEEYKSIVYDAMKGVHL